MNRRVIVSCWLPPKKFAAITLFGLIFTRKREYITERLLNHELIHCRQQLEWLYIPFYILYVGEWLWYLVRYRDRDRAYRAISFEREAYANESDPGYLARRRAFANYRKQ